MKKTPLIFALLLLMGISIYAQVSMEKATICWDTSLSMRDRDFDKEIAFLDIYFAEKQNIDVVLLMFNNDIISTETFAVRSADWADIKNKLSVVDYDGSTSYRSLSDQIENGDVLLFTDGEQNTSLTSPLFKGNVYIINSKQQCNRANLNLLTIINSGEFVNLSEVKNSTPEDDFQLYYGKVYAENTILKEVSVAIKGQDNVITRSNENGTYRIEAKPGDVLIFSMGNKESVEKQVGKNRNINVWLEVGDGIRLDEVVVEGSKENEAVEEVDTGYGNQNKDAVGYAVQSIDQDDISAGSTDISSAVQGKFSGVTLGQNDDLSQVELRPKSSILSNNYGLIVIDGVPLPKSNSSAYNSSGRTQSTDFINPNNIASITVLKGLAATNRYGSLGSNGVIMITTKTATHSSSKVKKDLALVTNNIYEGKLKVNNKLLVTPYLKELKKGKNVIEAYGIYLNQREKYWHLPEYYVDVYNFFKESSKGLAIQILSNSLEKDNPLLMELKAMMFILDEQKNYQLALDVANRILELYPGQIQSYIDTALEHKNSGNNQIALNMLNNIANGSINPDLNFLGLQKTIGTEIRNLVHVKGSELDLENVDAKYLNNITYDARVIFDWNNDDAEFELKFVNPQKRFFNWDHTDLNNSQRIRDELDNGYGKEEFEIVGAEVKGEWLINITYLGNRNSNNDAPTFIKCKVQYNFGKPNQKTEEHVLRLYEKGKEELFVKLNIQ